MQLLNSVPSIDMTNLQPYLKEGDLACFLASDFICMCQEKPSKQYLLNFIAQHYYYSKQFTRFLCAVMSSVKKERFFNSLLANLLDEAGLTHEHKTPHSVLYKNMLNSLGVSRQTINPTTQFLIDTMYQYVRSTNPIESISALCLGSEAIVSYLYSEVYSALLKVGYENDDLQFFTIHIECDDEHASILKSIIDQLVNNHPSNLQLAQEVACQLIQARTHFLEGCMHDIV